MKFVMTSEVGDCRTVCLQALASDVTSPVSALIRTSETMIHTYGV